MGIVIQQSFRASIVSYIGAALGYVNMLLLFPLCFNAEQIGLYRLIIEISAVLAMLSQLGVGSIGVRYFPFYQKNNVEQDYFFSFLLILPLIGAGIVVGVSLVFQDNILMYYSSSQSGIIKNYYHVILIITFLISYNGVFDTISQFNLKTVIPKIISEVIVRFLVSVFAVAYLLKWFSFDQFIYSLIIVYFLALLINIVYSFSLQKIVIKVVNIKSRIRKFKEMLTYGLFMLLGASGSILVSKIDIIMISSMIGFTDTGIYSVAFFIAIVIELPRRSISKITKPLVAKALKDNDFKKINTLYHQTSLNQLIVGGTLFILIWVNVDSLFSLIPNGDQYANGKYVVLYILLAKLFDMAMGINAEILFQSKYYKWNIILMPVFGLVAIGTNYILIPIYGITGAAIASVISVFMYNMMRFLILFYKMNLQPFKKQNLIALFILVINIIVFQFISFNANFFLSIIVKSTLVSIGIIIPVYFSKISLDLNNIVLLLLKRITSRT